MTVRCIALAGPEGGGKSTFIRTVGHMYEYGRESIEDASIESLSQIDDMTLIRNGILHLRFNHPLIAMLFTLYGIQPYSSYSRTILRDYPRVPLSMFGGRSFWELQRELGNHLAVMDKYALTRFMANRLLYVLDEHPHIHTIIMRSVMRQPEAEFVKRMGFYIIGAARCLNSIASNGNSMRPENVEILQLMAEHAHYTIDHADLFSFMTGATYALDKMPDEFTIDKSKLIARCDNYIRDLDAGVANNSPRVIFS